MKLIAAACMAFIMGFPMMSIAGEGVPVDDEGLPVGIKIHASDEGPVFANEAGMTLYTLSDEEAAVGVSWCKDVGYKQAKHELLGYVHALPNLDHRPTCVQKNPPARVKDGAKPAGKWSIVEREDGIRQWAYQGHPLYTSVKDEAPGQTNADSRGKPLYVPFDVPAGIYLFREGRVGALLTSTTERTASAKLTVYTHDLDSATESKCDRQCAATWQPVLAPVLAMATGDWSVVKRGDGTLQWAFRGKPLYTYFGDFNPGDLNGQGVKNWHVAVVYPRIGTPPEISKRMTFMGEVPTDTQGHTVYWFHCTEDGPDKLDCDDPSDRNPIWYIVCGNTPAACAKEWHPVLVPPNAKNVGYSWTAVTMPLPWSPVRAGDGGEEGPKVWAYKGRPVFTYYDDQRPGDTNGWGISLHLYTLWNPVGSRVVY
jgi:predicted lipoprotein with Yx(FWY)xxD motif